MGITEEFTAKFAPVLAPRQLKVKFYEQVELNAEKWEVDVRVHLESTDPAQIKKIYRNLPIPAKPYLPTAARFSLKNLAGCCGAVISWESYVEKEWRGQGLGQLMQEMKVYLAEKLRVGLLLATVVQGNEAEERLLRKSGWTPSSPFANPKTNNQIQVWQKVICPPKE